MYEEEQVAARNAGRTAAEVRVLDFLREHGHHEAAKALEAELEIPF